MANEPIFKSAMHMTNWKMVQLEKKNRKQAVKVYSREELEAYAAANNMKVSDKSTAKPLAEMENIDYSVLPQDVLDLIGKK